MQTAQEMKDRESRREREEKPDVQGRCHRAEGENSVWRLKKFQSTPGIEPGTLSSSVSTLPLRHHHGLNQKTAYLNCPPVSNHLLLSPDTL